MANYRAQMNTLIGSPTWFWEFEANNDQEAIEQVSRVMKQDFGVVYWVKSVDINTTSTACMKMVTFGYERNVANLELDDPNISVTTREATE